MDEVEKLAREFCVAAGEIPDEDCRVGGGVFHDVYIEGPNEKWRRSKYIDAANAVIDSRKMLSTNEITDICSEMLRTKTPWMAGETGALLNEAGWEALAEMRLRALERMRAALAEIADFGGSQNDDAEPCREIARKALRPNQRLGNTDET